MWIYQKKIHIVASKELRGACLKFTEKLDSCLGFNEKPGEQIPDGTNLWLFINHCPADTAANIDLVCCAGRARGTAIRP
jgi:hypothetical protein